MTSTYTFYLALILLNLILVKLSEVFPINNKPNPLFWNLSMFSLFFVMGYRTLEVGVDDRNYLLNYDAAKNLSIIDYYSNRVTEPGFYILNKVVYFIFDDFQMVIVISSLLTIFLFYKAFEFEFKKISLTLLVFVFITTQYFYYFGIVRLGIAAAIMSFAYRYIVSQQTKKLIISIMIATMFHYSALFCLIFILFFDKPMKSKIKSYFGNNQIVKAVIFIPFSFLIVRFVLYPFITIDRYQNYINSEIMFDFGFITTLPFLLIFLFKLKDINKDEQYKLYFILFLVKIIIEIFSPLIGIGRMVWYVNLTFCYLMCRIITIEKNIFFKYIFFLLVIGYSLYYLNYAYLSDISSVRSMYLIPYKNKFFEFIE